MVYFCKKCKSIMIGGSCSNQKCTNHVQCVIPATFSQVNYIKSLAEKLDYDDSEQDYDNLTAQQADKLIKELLDKLEVRE